MIDRCIRTKWKDRRWLPLAPTIRKLQFSRKPWSTGMEVKSFCDVPTCSKGVLFERGACNSFCYRPDWCNSAFDVSCALAGAVWLSDIQKRSERVSACVYVSVRPLEHKRFRFAWGRAASAKCSHVLRGIDEFRADRAI